MGCRNLLRSAARAGQSPLRIRRVGLVGARTGDAGWVPDIICIHPWAESRGCHRLGIGRAVRIIRGAAPVGAAAAESTSDKTKKQDFFHKP